MKASKEQVKKYVIEYLQDGKRRNTTEIRQFLDSKGVTFENNSGAFRTIMYSLKKENTYLKNPERGIYYLEEPLESPAKFNPNDDVKSDSNYDFEGFEDFEVVKSSTHQKTAYVVSVLADGTLSINSKLLAYFPDQTAEIRIKRDCSQIVFFREGKNAIRLGKNGRFKNYDILDKIKANGFELPIFYVGDWNEQKKLWLGIKTNENPNRNPRK